MTSKDYIEKQLKKSTYDLHYANQKNAPAEHIKNIDDKINVLNELLDIVKAQSEGCHYCRLNDEGKCNIEVFNDSENDKTVEVQFFGGEITIKYGDEWSLTTPYRLLP